MPHRNNAIRSTITESSFEVILARLILNSAEMHERSFDHQAADKIVQQCRDEQHSDRSGVFVDIDKFYAVTIQEAATKTATKYGYPLLVQPVYLALKYTWNDSLAWAEEIITQLTLNSQSENKIDDSQSVARIMTPEDVERQYENGVHIGSGLPREVCPCGLCAKNRTNINQDGLGEATAKQALNQHGHL